MIKSVLGPISVENLGVTLPHEHIFIDMKHCVQKTGKEPPIFYEKISLENRGEVFTDPYAILDNAALESDLCFERAVKEMEYFKSYGGQTVVDCTLDEIGRDPIALKKLSEITGINIILGCGHYYDRAHFPYVKNATADELSREMITDLTVGIRDTGIRSGVIGEIGTSDVMTENEIKSLHAAGMASVATSRPIHVHTGLYSENGEKIIKILTGEGVAPEKICIDHVDVVLRKDYIKRLLALGVYVEFDDFGKEFYVNKASRFAYDLERILLLSELIREGHGDRILITNDICLKTMYRTYGGCGYAHVLRGVREMALENGIDESAYKTLTVNNPREFLK